MPPVVMLGDDPAKSGSVAGARSSEQADESLTVKVLPAVSELLDRHVDVADIRDVDEVDLLGRQQTETDITEIAGYPRGKRILVTGAGEGIGSEPADKYSATPPPNS